MRVFQRAPRAVEPADVHMTIIEHLEALRRVLIVCIVAWALCTAAGWFVAVPVYDWVVHRAGLDHVYILKPTGGFFLILKVAIYIGFALASPVIIHQVWSFVAPGLYRSERRLFGPLVVATFAFFALGIGFALFSLPLIVHVLVSFIPAQVGVPLFDAEEILGFILGLIIAFGLVFELPVVIFVLGQLRIVNSRWLWKNRLYWFLGLAIVANFLTPGADPLTPLILFVPLYIFYEGSTLLLRLTGK